MPALEIGVGVKSLNPALGDRSGVSAPLVQLPTSRLSSDRAFELPIRSGHHLTFNAPDIQGMISVYLFLLVQIHYPIYKFFLQGSRCWLLPSLYTGAERVLIKSTSNWSY